MRWAFKRNKREPTPEEQQYWRFRNLNAAIGGLGCLGMLCGGFFFLLTAFGIVSKLWLPTVIVCWGIIPCLSRHVRKTGAHKRLLYLMRAAGISLLAAIVLAPTLILWFEDVPLLYPAKRMAFTQGVRNPKLARVILPYLLPWQHTDYCFITEPSLIAQDYTPFAYLFLHTDGETLRDYETALQGNEHLERRENRAYTPEALAEDAALEYQNLPRFVYARMIADAGITDDLSHAIVYQGDNSGTWHCGSGALINYETGLLIVWL